MKKVERILFEAFDGKTFETERACKDYEDSNVHLRVANLTVAQVLEAITYSDPDLSDALEYAGDLCKEARKAAGVFRRLKRGLPEPEPAQTEEAA